MEKQVLAEEWILTAIPLYVSDTFEITEEDKIKLKQRIIEDLLRLPILKDIEINLVRIEGIIDNLLNDFESYDAASTTMLTSDTEQRNWINDAPQNYNYWERWKRFRNYLMGTKNRSAKEINKLNTVSSQILNQLGNPILDTFDKRGLAVGYVQSGKTENYIALINKAIDSGYKLVIVLSGIHNDLRSQTQTRIDEEVIGIDTNELTEQIGVGLIKVLNTNHITRRTKDGDISSAMAKTPIHQIIKNDQPTVIVTKKVSSVLEALKDILSRVDSNLPLLIIDDEADQASIDVKNSQISRNDNTYEPSPINKLIREILVLFNKRSYVGYTATPFANILIDHRINHPRYGYDLFPKDFIIDLPKNKEYLGPDELFGFEDGEGLPLIRIIEDPDAAIRKVYNSEEIPEDMAKAIKSFIISTAIRQLRGQANSHNSMLIHLNRSVDYQDQIAGIVRKEFETVKDGLEKEEDGIVESFKELWHTDYVATSLEMQIFNEIEPWKEVYDQMLKVVGLIKIMVINGESDDSLDYKKYVDEGLNVIAIGGDKLSRGLTLEGLTVSYYLRSSQTYDTLMQMGRWFGYKKDFEDLCRIYISLDLVSDFRAIALANLELRALLEEMKEKDQKPIDFGLRIRSHSVMDVTSILKLRSSSTSIEMKSYAGRKPQTILFNSSNKVIINNYNKTLQFLEKLPVNFNKYGSEKMIRLWSEVNIGDVIEYLKEIDMPEDATFGNPEKWAKYIKHEFEMNNMSTFRVVLMSNQSQKNTINMAGHVCNRPSRRIYPISNLDRISIGILRSGDDIAEIGSYLSEEINDIKEPVLLIYPLVLTNDKNPLEDIEQFVIGLSIVFPESETEDVEYRLNTVEQGKD